MERTRTNPFRRLQYKYNNFTVELSTLTYAPYVYNISIIGKFKPTQIHTLELQACDKQELLYKTNKLHNSIKNQLINYIKNNIVGNEDYSFKKNFISDIKVGELSNITNTLMTVDLTLMNNNKSITWDNYKSTLKHTINSFIQHISTVYDKYEYQFVK